jgi:Arc/MetJ family transcription regulator
VAITSIDIDPQKVATVRQLTGADSNRAAVDLALDLVIERHLFAADRIAALIAETPVHRQAIIELGDR